MTKITYLFGAGASALALPVITNIPDRLSALIAEFEKPEYELDETQFENRSGMPATKRRLQKQLITLLQWSLEQALANTSIDTAAKRFYLNGQYEELSDLKIAMLIFFTYEEVVNRPDKRYHHFIASLLETTNHNFPRNIKILSWNYDLQFELSYRYFSSRPLTHCHQLLNVIRKGQGYYSNEDKFSIIKLNGSAIYSQIRGAGTEPLYCPLPHGMDNQVIEYLVQMYGFLKYSKDLFTTGISFAWEKENPSTSVVNRAKELIRTTDILVVIGYSFPYFNRRIDSEILNGMMPAKIYIQDCDPENVISNLESILDRSCSIEPRKKVNEFFFPSEFWREDR